jgi:hypothetical protein
MEEHSQYLVVPDEVLGFPNSPSLAIPTFGAATTPIEQYRTVAVASTNLPDLGVAFTDGNAVAAISLVAEGGLTDVMQLEAAETALQALLLHNIVHVLIPAPKADFGNRLVSYIRGDSGQRTAFGFELFSLAKSRDWLIAPEFLRVTDGVLIRSTLQNSPLVGMTVDQFRTGMSYSNADVNDAINVAVESHGVPAYLTDPALVRSRRGDGFSKRFYHRIRQSWDEAVGGIPPVVCSFSLPPLLAVVLDRLNSRADLRTVIADLRDELAPVRDELREFNNIVTQSTPQAEIEARVHRITESFDAIVPESRLSGAQRRRRRILSIQGIVRPLIKFAMGFATNNGASLENGIQVANGASDLLFESRAVVDRTITAQTFVGLLNTESLQSLVKHHFSSGEIDSIERSIRNR